MIRQSLLILVMSAALVNLSGCKQYVETIADLKKDLIDFKKSTATELAAYKSALALTQETLGKEIIALNQKVAELQAKVATLDKPQEAYQAVVLDPKVFKVYQRLDANVGTFLVSLDNIQSDKNDVKVTLNVGNPSTMAFYGFKLQATWGPDSRKDYTLTETLKPGTWNKVTISLPKTNLKDIQKLALVIVTDRIHMK